MCARASGIEGLFRGFGVDGASGFLFFGFGFLSELALEKMFSFQSPFEKGVSKPQVSQGFKVLGFWRLTTSLADAGFLCLTPMGGFGALKGPLRGCELP